MPWHNRANTASIGDIPPIWWPILARLYNPAEGGKQKQCYTTISERTYCVSAADDEALPMMMMLITRGYQLLVD